jgi:hypothetical protein
MPFGRSTTALPNQPEPTPYGPPSLCDARPARELHPKQLIELNKIYMDDSIYGGDKYDVMKDKIKIFECTCAKLLISH